MAVCPGACRRGRMDPGHPAGHEFCLRLPECQAARLRGQWGTPQGCPAGKEGTLRAPGEGQGRRPVCEGDAPAVRATEEEAPLPRPNHPSSPFPSPSPLPSLSSRTAASPRTPGGSGPACPPITGQGFGWACPLHPITAQGQEGAEPAEGRVQRPDTFSQTARWVRRRPGGGMADGRTRRACGCV